MAKVPFTVNWRLEGVAKAPLLAGARVMLDPEAEETQSFLQVGVITREDSTSTTVEKLTKAEIVALAKDRFKVDLDGSLKKEELLSQFADFQAAQDAEQAEAAQVEAEAAAAEQAANTPDPDADPSDAPAAPEGEAAAGGQE